VHAQIIDATGLTRLHFQRTGLPPD
jgi:hypothetical protein